VFPLAELRDLRVEEFHCPGAHNDRLSGNVGLAARLGSVTVSVIGKAVAVNGALISNTTTVEGVTVIVTGATVSISSVAGSIRSSYHEGSWSRTGYWHNVHVMAPTQPLEPGSVCSVTADGDRIPCVLTDDALFDIQTVTDLFQRCSPIESDTATPLTPTCDGHCGPLPPIEEYCERMAVLHDDAVAACEAACPCATAEQQLECVSSPSRP